ncbi:MAG TPA: preprotein translocase subunit SecG [Candidatus Paceibacterota bacterium]
MQSLLFWGQIGVSVLLIGVILLQQRGTGLGSSFGGSGQFYRSKRGFEKFLFVSTIILAVVFSLTAIANLII